MTTPVLLLLVVSLLATHIQANDDSLKSALEAISRRQRDLATSGGSGYFAGLSQYRFPQREAEEELAFLTPAREFAGDGQPENIGYGYQKSAPSTGTVYSSAPQGSPGGHRSAATNKALEKLLVEYLEDEYSKNGNNEDTRYYHHGQDSKRSVFREREGGDLTPESQARFRPVGVGRLEAMRKRGNMILPTAFRERVNSNNRLVPDEEGFEAAKRRHNFAKALAKEIEEEEEDDMEREREEKEEENKEEEYLDLLQNLWEKYKQSNPSVVNIEDLTPEDVQELLSSLGDGESPERNALDGIRAEAAKRQYGDSYGTGYDFFNHPGGMNGWGAIQYKKRAKQRIDGNDNQQGSFLYSLKFVSPSNREAVEALKEDDSVDLPDERDEDILRIATGNYNRQEPEVWIPNYEQEEPIEETFDPTDENYQRLIMQSQNTHSASRKRVSQPSRSNFGIRPVVSAELMLPDGQLDKRYMYEAAKHKRFPVTKRSSNFYASPPLLHHKSFVPVETRMKKDASVSTGTDPKVARELNQIFSSSANNDDLSEENARTSRLTGASSSTSKTDSATEAEVTTYVSVISHNDTEKAHPSNSSDNTKSDNQSKSENHKNESVEHVELSHQEQSLGDGETVEQPITMSRIQTPLEIKKKSIDWSDYVGIDRRKKKAGSININDLEGSGDGVVDDDWLLNQYYKTLAMSTNAKKRMPMHNPEHDHMIPSQAKEKKEHEDQPFDTRLFDADIFSRSAQREGLKLNSQKKDANEESRIDNMDSKLRNIEDVIVNEAIKYTGSHEGTTDPKEIQEVKDRVLSRLAAAYSLEKMRLALREFKSSLQAQKMSKYNPENQRSSHNSNDDDKKDKRVAVKKEKAEDENKTEGKEEDDDEKKKKRDDKKDEDVREFTNSLSDIEPLSEGYMGRAKPKTHEDCPALNYILHKCHNVASLSGDEEQLFVPLCSWHQMCYLCGQEAGYSSQTACDFRFLKEADSMCMEDLSCQQIARRSATILEHSQPGEGNDIQCWNNSCIAHYFLTSLLPNNWSR
ncbi:zinc finger CCCH domain-containing protein 13 [Anabrus simplex]|uniref:zinc finger CCCH domain-containing protein 13 n=1 Tax=Anabrus simplex TaxID=316456 RepID=UPI0035A3A120